MCGSVRRKEMSSSGQEDKIVGEGRSAPPLVSSDTILPWLGSKDLGLGAKRVCWARGSVRSARVCGHVMLVTGQRHALVSFGGVAFAEMGEVLSLPVWWLAEVAASRGARVCS